MEIKIASFTIGFVAIAQRDSDPYKKAVQGLDAPKMRLVFAEQNHVVKKKLETIETAKFSEHPAPEHLYWLSGNSNPNRAGRANGFC